MPSNPTSGGLKGFLQRAYGSSTKAYASILPLCSRTYAFLSRSGFVISATLFVTLIPLIMEIDREGVVMADEKLKVADLRSKGFQDSQMMQMGLSESAVYGTSVL
eukprot:CAMPEP_0182463668 /NCGR_PEP_ID=MMETSP1319-20130603/7828_1 /TAXON_ID=172717 /ORGANISM="Bolidomonas pacifica, Strain RCC208" /LENGTH=104 /DNA_ID=CAMNT_0024663239 /DNA_START=11 /DNA_END=325 /DNA_ORIENTATION=+